MTQSPQRFVTCCSEFVSQSDGWLAFFSPETDVFIPPMGSLECTCLFVSVFILFYVITHELVPRSFQWQNVLC